MTETYETIPDVPLNDEFFNAVREAGASRMFMEVIKVLPDDLPEGVERNMAQTEVRKYCYWEDEISPEAIENNVHLGGGFFKSLWNGDTDNAIGRADPGNMKILRSLGYTGGAQSSGLVEL